MEHLPTIIGLIMCELAVVEKNTENISLINCFTKKKVEEFPSPPQRFSVVVLMTDGFGDLPMDLVIKSLDSLEEIYHRSVVTRFPNRLLEVRFHFRITDCKFPSAGLYDVCLVGKNELLGQHRLLVG